ncbi:O-antigen ligase family protein [Marivirga sp.]|uniref:O-antigen ligase family protein n=1 Tax=Marivirga sp. TaxID=2018662 RepID=UPI002D808563|nr:O-antigen ligase family protein [Marivirga sp.]HET8858750.1 O-antigen ligase family protein [Marivirga sp.]
MLILPTVTRLNIAFYLFLPFFLFFAKKNRLIRLVVLLIYMTLLNLTYPVYNSIIKNYPSLVEVRYESGRDASFGLRYALFNKTLEKFSELTTNEKLLGAGNEASRNMIKANFKSDLQTHNDFIRFLFDFGIIPTLMFLTFLLIIFSKNKATFMIGLIYLVSFYHNMLYQLIFILLAIYFFKIKLNEN